MKHAIIHKSGKIERIVTVSIDSDLALNVREGETCIEIQSEHPVLKERDTKWKVRDGVLIKKTDEEIRLEVGIENQKFGVSKLTTDKEAK